jgi:hypothetical protein
VRNGNVLLEVLPTAFPYAGTIIRTKHVSARLYRIESLTVNIFAIGTNTTRTGLGAPGPFRPGAAVVRAENRQARSVLVARDDVAVYSNRLAIPS